MIPADVTIVLLGVLLLLLAPFGLALAYDQAKISKKLQELRESGIETEARLVALRRYSSPDFVSATYEIDVPGGDPAQGKKQVRIDSGPTIGSFYPVVRHPMFPSQFELGTKDDLGPRRALETARKLRWRYWSVGFILSGLVLVVVGVLL
ncbi:hypothetical protein AB0P36_33745 [Streptomyces flavidovirens]|uniref:hypothetical protein n=1 Tax=Streptomyces flavidovirens TaxID=67298 RepID=UPI00343E1DE3